MWTSSDFKFYYNTNAIKTFFWKKKYATLLGLFMICTYNGCEVDNSEYVGSPVTTVAVD